MGAVGGRNHGFFKRDYCDWFSGGISDTGFQSSYLKSLIEQNNCNCFPALPGNTSSIDLASKASVKNQLTINHVRLFRGTLTGFSSGGSDP